MSNERGFGLQLRRTEPTLVAEWAEGEDEPRSGGEYNLQRNGFWIAVDTVLDADASTFSAVTGPLA